MVLFMEDFKYCSNETLEKEASGKGGIYMFKPRRTKLLKRIWKFPKLLVSMSRSECLEIKFQLHCLLKTLTERDLDILLKSLQSEGGVDTDCICMKTNDLRNFRQKFNCEPNFILIKTFRFPKTTENDVVKSLICCSQRCSDEGVCLNPYHSSVVIDIEPSLPPYLDEEVVERLSPPIELRDKESTSSEGSFDSTASNVWCRISYWEQKERVGRIFDVRQDSISVFDDFPQGNGLCLSLLEYGSVPHTNISDKIKETIGHGFQLTREAEGVWLYNRSSIVLFAGSPTIQMEGIELLHPVVKRLPPGTSILVCDKKLMNSESKDNETSSSDKSSPYQSKRQSFPVRVSFGKGWGVNYRRLFVTQCPCWVEINIDI